MNFEKINLNDDEFEVLGEGKSSDQITQELDKKIEELKNPEPSFDASEIEE